MWPWEAAIFAYLLYAIYTHVKDHTKPGRKAIAVAALASIVPDLIDKPLAWQFGLISNGYGPGHSIFVGSVVALGALAVGQRFDRSQLGVAFAVGYLSHNLGDVLEHLVRGQGWRAVETALWPVFTHAATRQNGLTGTTNRYFTGYAHDLLTGHVRPYLALVGTIFLLALLVWIHDESPGFGGFKRAIGRWM